MKTLERWSVTITVDGKFWDLGTLHKTKEDAERQLEALRGEKPSSWEDDRVVRVLAVIDEDLGDLT